MDRKNLLIAGGWAGGLIVIIIILVIGVFIIIPSITNNLTSNSDENLKSEPNENTVYFDNSTPEATAISIARLNEGMIGFHSGHKVNASLTSDGKYWIVDMDGWVVTIDTKTWMSKQNMERVEGKEDIWRSLDELKARYVAEIQSNDEEIGEPSKIVRDGKEIWKVPVYSQFKVDQMTYDEEDLVGYVYVDLATGKSEKVYVGVFNKINALLFKDIKGIDGWLTLKELDAKINRTYGSPQMPFKDALRDLYLE